MADPSMSLLDDLRSSFNANLHDLSRTINLITGSFTAVINTILSNPLLLFLSLCFSLLVLNRLICTPVPTRPNLPRRKSTSPFLCPSPHSEVTPQSLPPPQQARPFPESKPGQHIPTLGIRKLDPNDWLRLDSDFLRFHEEKLSRMHTPGIGEFVNDCIDYSGSHGVRDVEEARAACFEVLERAAVYLGHKYPGVYTLYGFSEQDETDQSPTLEKQEKKPQQPNRGITNHITGKYYTLPPYRPSLPSSEEARQALRTLAELTQEDVILLLPSTSSPTGPYRVVAGSVVIPGSWRLRDKLGHELDIVHGPVPHYEDRLKPSFGRFFHERITTDKSWERYGFTIQPRGGLGWSGHVGDEQAPRDQLDASERTMKAGDEIGVEECWVRVERQTLTRLDGTDGGNGAVVFTVRSYLERVEDVARERGMAKVLANAVRGWSGDMGGYKAIGVWGETVLGYLDYVARREDEQGDDAFVVGNRDDDGEDGLEDPRLNMDGDI
ncbi:hypothetical protein BJ508DRAFT_377168 [Ascobolus immersus RN42]|uniref:Uncharacterized protein n=1 Tax=Ascobolus immersus RN42 TaxID=1160509 RepID=A0A3N4I2Z1_ASCIM|nr:hypothetical protein BJ508DRAFT_377168 [Ascobolus immersus RN42]